MATLKHGDSIALHTKVNIDPLGSHCSICGGRTKSPLWFPLNWSGKIDATSPEADIWGYWPVGSECAKKFESGLLITK
jgi:hypothetical protein